MVGPFFGSFRKSYASRLIVGLGLAATTLAVIGYSVTSPAAEPAAAFDEGIRKAAQSFASPYLTLLLKIVTKFGSTLVLTIVGAVALIVFAIQRWTRAAALFAIAMFGQIGLHEGFKVLIQRERPSVPFEYTVAESYSFPSGHALAAACVYGMLAWIITRRLRSKRLAAIMWVAAATLVFLIGFSRIYFNVHYASDVLAGFVAALIWTAAVASGDTRL